MRFNAGRAAEHDDGAVEYAQGALNLDGEVDVTGRVDDVDAMLVVLLVHALPEARGRGGSDRDAALLFLLHPVHDRSAVVDLADLVGEAGVEQHALGCGRLARVDVGDDADVAVAANGCAASHL